jgi:hypothetical protein
MTVRLSYGAYTMGPLIYMSGASNPQEDHACYVAVGPLHRHQKQAIGSDATANDFKQRHSEFTLR